jgi:AcrR family transcriptional regulator
MAAIAADAGVALKTVYVAFTTKSGLLTSLWNLLLRGADDGIAVHDRDWYREVLDEPDPARQLRLNARNSRAVKERVGAVMAVIRSAAPLDPEIDALWDRIQSQFHENQAEIVRRLEAKGALRPGLDVARAADILWTLNHPDVWLLLVRDRGWTPAAYEEWFGEVACAQLLAGSAVRPV